MIKETLQQPCQHLLKVHKAADLFHDDQYIHSLNNQILSVCYQLFVSESKVYKGKRLVLVGEVLEQPIAIETKPSVQLWLMNADETAKTPKAH